ncbi:jg13196, partial [Pararge aegeria aegeria]
DKALLNKNAAERIDKEKSYIFRIIGGLKCFKRYPNHVKKKLAAVTYFKYFGPGRVIVRQHQEAHAMYFIISGDVTVSQLVFDELIQQYVSVDIGVMKPGDMFGEVSLLHNIPRTATVTTNDHCELLALMKEDFKNVLQASIQKQWDDVRSAMSAFTYFDALDEVALREGCIVAKMKSYGINETVLGDGVGVANFVYFILSGRCQMIESIQVFVSERLGKKYYTLSDSYVPKEESEHDFDTKYFGAYKNLKKEERESDVIVNNDKERAESSSKGESCSSKRDSGQRAENYVDAEKTKGTVEFQISEEPKSEEFIKAAVSTDYRESVRMSVIPEVMDAALLKTKQNLKTYFMQVCQFNPGSTFGFGENMRDRRIVALTPVSCMLLPKIWLLQRNTANIWTRIQHYLEKKIPTKKQLFKEFVSARRWQDFREELVEDVISRSNTVNWTSVHDVPYSIRMEEMLDI